MEQSQLTTIEINGVKLEVDLRSARRIETLRVGSRVKCLVKGYGGAVTVSPGVVVGFEPFPSLPTIVVAYLEQNYTVGLTFKALNAKTEDFEIVADLDQNSLEVNRDGVVRSFDRDIAKKEIELRELVEKKAFFLSKFGSYFADVAE